MQGAAATFLRVDVEVNAFMTDARLFLQLEPPGNLFRTPVQTQQAFDQGPGFAANARLIGFTLPIVSEFIGLIWTIALRSAVAAQLARDGALMTTEQQRDLRLVLAGLLQCVDLVSSYPGKLRIVHLCASLTWWLEKHAYAIAACS